MLAKKTLTLPRAKDLQSNTLEALQNHLALLYEELDKAWRRLYGDLSTIQVSGDGWIYFGGKDVAGSVRIGLSGTDWVCQHLIAGTYVERLASSP